jgi:hypothetical protein
VSPKNPQLPDNEALAADVARLFGELLTAIHELREEAREQTRLLELAIERLEAIERRTT